MSPKEKETVVTTSWLEVLVLEYNAIVKIIRTKKFRDLSRAGSEAHFTRFAIYEQRQYDLLQDIKKLEADLGGSVVLWDGLFK